MPPAGCRALKEERREVELIRSSRLSLGLEGVEKIDRILLGPE